MRSVVFGIIGLLLFGSFAYAQQGCSVSITRSVEENSVCKPAVNHTLTNNCANTADVMGVDQFGWSGILATLRGYETKKSHCCGPDCLRKTYTSYNYRSE